MEKVKHYKIFWDGENSTIFKALNEDDEDNMTFQQAKNILRGFMYRMAKKYNEGKSRISHLKEKDVTTTKPTVETAG